MADDPISSALEHVVAGLPGGGEAREGQREMAQAVGRAFEKGRHLVVRAGTGTGKSLGYLVPAVLSNKKVLIATATKNLQDQLFEKDLPDLAARLGRPVSYSVLKGRSNYLCVQAVKESEALGDQGVLGEDSSTTKPVRDGIASDVMRVIEWSKTTTTGDRAELTDEIDSRVWSSLSTTAEECPGAYNCPSGSECFAEAAREKAEESQVVVVNLHLLGADLKTGGTVLPPYDVLVIDEAHELEDVMSASLGYSISASSLRSVAGLSRESRGTRARGSQDVEDLFEVATSLDEALSSLVGQRVEPGRTDMTELFSVLGLASARLGRLEARLSSQQDGAQGLGTQGLGRERSARALLFAARVREHLDSLSLLDEQQVAWVQAGTHPSIEVAPLDVAPVLSERLFGEHPVVLTSATVSLGLSRRVGADPDNTDQLDVGSPFSFSERALLYCAAHLPDRRRENSADALHEEIEALINAARGRTLALFTSRVAMERATEVLRKRIEYPILCQGDASKGALVEEFTRNIESSLFATMSFWQGVDVPGETLSLVIIDKIPFSRPNDPLLSARREAAGPDAFKTIDLPRAASLLAQGAGRLVRNASDRGVVAVLDPRLASASYRWDLVNALPPMTRTKDRHVVETYLASIAEGRPELSSV